MSPAPMQEADLRRIKEAVAVLAEHFDSIQVFATRHEPATTDGTLSYHWGCGNWYARYGQISLWLQRERVRDIAG